MSTEYTGKPVLLVILASVLSSVIGAGAMFLWVEASTPGEDSADAGFLRDMSTHHAQAVEMSIYEYKYGENENMRAIAYDILTAQQGEIGAMRSLLNQWELNVTHSDPMVWAEDADVSESDANDKKGVMMAGMATPEQLKEFKTLIGAEADLRFAELMIAHHEGGIDMAAMAVDLADEAVVVNMAERMVAVQKQEIIDMELIMESINTETS
ncbi:DUF305 domain-containing protein [Haloglycomyces albus]|uniref:DUF305 domain-containing protein n=1 Tax=Haloglycomyces albus TaxID=526067 RepID=UPI00046CEB64|nr:DUF305 domain-containing protein [Haloglycomyces albus]